METMDGEPMVAAVPGAHGLTSDLAGLRLETRQPTLRAARATWRFRIADCNGNPVRDFEPEQGWHELVQDDQVVIAGEALLIGLLPIRCSIHLISLELERSDQDRGHRVRVIRHEHAFVITHDSLGPPMATCLSAR